mgnify:FL=1
MRWQGESYTVDTAAAAAAVAAVDSVEGDLSRNAAEAAVVAVADIVGLVSELVSEADTVSAPMAVAVGQPVVSACHLELFATKHTKTNGRIFTIHSIEFINFTDENLYL